MILFGCTCIVSGQSALVRLINVCICEDFVMH